MPELFISTQTDRLGVRRDNHQDARRRRQSTGQVDLVRLWITELVTDMIANGLLKARGVGCLDTLNCRAIERKQNLASRTPGLPATEVMFDFS